MAKKIKVDIIGNSYDIHIGVSLDDIGVYLGKSGFSGNVLIVTNTTVGKIYGCRVMEKLAGSGFLPAMAAVPDGEKHKTLDTVRKLYGACLEAGIDRGSPVIALGGGVVGDTAGFVAATFKRGVPLVQVPTTLLSMVDSSVGGKTGVNLEQSKNLIGSFYQPKLVLTDISTLRTLKKREFTSGLAEVIKYGVIKDKNFFEYIEKNIGKIGALDAGALEFVICKSCDIKKNIVEIDEKERGIRAILNFGHTIGHAIEAETGYGKYLHGEAISVGMVCASKISVRLGIFGKKDAARIERLLKMAGLPASHGLNPDRIIARLAYDKKTKNGRVNFVLPNKNIGQVTVKDNVPGAILRDVLREVKK